MEALLFFMHNEYWSGPFPSWRGFKTGYSGTCLWAECLPSEGALWHCPTSVRSQVWSPRVRSCGDPVTWLHLRHSNPVIHNSPHRISHQSSNPPQISWTLIPNGKILIYCPKLALAHHFLHPSLPTASDFRGWLLPVRPLFKIPPLKQIQCSTFLNARRSQGGLLQFQPHLPPGSSCSQGSPCAGRSTRKDGRAESLRHP